MADGGSIRARLARPFDPAELRRIKRLWVRHSTAEDRRDIEGLVATLAPDRVLPWDPPTRRFRGERIWLGRGLAGA